MLEAIQIKQFRIEKRIKIQNKDKLARASIGKKICKDDGGKEQETHLFISPEVNNLCEST